ncbi:WD-40 repeat-containing protein [Tieghemostelium lacteum]|uniref:WD-40 repeat-containing protein n=1 Tax=Tieghemostelium lacteum TaxID=361077 RepID=A0A152A8U3_TIELA|nr:WD-40 repeat-containing protein [Tieghemostelium lacteum]|eukprot:KYR02646.1 WD-40 repeat-containing protein [Tieghemostelium lacteum]
MNLRFPRASIHDRNQLAIYEKIYRLGIRCIRLDIHMNPYQCQSDDIRRIVDISQSGNIEKYSGFLFDTVIGTFPLLNYCRKVKFYNFYILLNNVIYQQSKSLNDLYPLLKSMTVCVYDGEDLSRITMVCPKVKLISHFVDLYSKPTGLSIINKWHNLSDLVLQSIKVDFNDLINQLVKCRSLNSLKLKSLDFRPSSSTNSQNQQQDGLYQQDEEYHIDLDCLILSILEIKSLREFSLHMTPRIWQDDKISYNALFKLIYHHQNLCKLSFNWISMSKESKINFCKPPSLANYSLTHLQLLNCQSEIEIFKMHQIFETCLNLESMEYSDAPQGPTNHNLSYLLQSKASLSLTIPVYGNDRVTRSIVDFVASGTSLNISNLKICYGWEISNEVFCQDLIRILSNVQSLKKIFISYQKMEVTQQLIEAFRNNHNLEDIEIEGGINDRLTCNLSRKLLLTILSRSETFSFSWLSYGFDDHNIHEIITLISNHPTLKKLNCFAGSINLTSLLQSKLF